MSTLTLRVPDELDKALERQSAALGISKSDLAREALKRYLDQLERADEKNEVVMDASAVAAALEKLKSDPEPEAGAPYSRVYRPPESWRL